VHLPPHPPGQGSQFRLIAACSIGNALEMFDFTVYSFFALLIGKLFFPSDSPYGSLLLAVATFGIGFVMRPLGGVVIGNYADRRGRKAAMTLTIGLMVLARCASRGGPDLRHGRRVGIADDPGGPSAAGLLAGRRDRRVHRDADGRRRRERPWLARELADRQPGHFRAGGRGGRCHATRCCPSRAESWGWRVPFLLGLLIAPVGLYIRANLDETHRPTRTPSPSASCSAGMRTRWCSASPAPPARRRCTWWCSSCRRT
jgi:MFS family permease